MRIVMMGTGPYAVPTLIKLYESAHEVAALITRPDSGGPGGRDMSINPLRQLAAAEGTPILDPEDVNSPASHLALNHFGPAVLIVCDYGQILSPDALDRFPFSSCLFNNHAQRNWCISQPMGMGLRPGNERADLIANRLCTAGPINVP